MDQPRVLLIAVHDSAHRILINEAMSGTPHHLVFASNGDDAYLRVAEVKPHMVVVHEALVGIDGYTLCRMIRDHLEASTVPVVLLGEPDREAESRQRAEAVDADLFVTTSLSPVELGTALRPLAIQGRATTDIKAPAAVHAERDTAADRFDTGPLRPDGDGLHGPGYLGETHPFAELASPNDPTDGAGLAAETNDIDTVVSFKNPFFEGRVDAAVDDGAVTTTEGREHVTQVAFEASMHGVATPSLSAPDSDPLEEPQIRPHVRQRGNGAEPEGHSAAGSASEESQRPISKSLLIEEVPRERTPTGDSGERSAPSVGVRRGLDESQLGKRLAKRVRATYRMLEEADYYQLLGVEPDADYARIRAAYYELSLEFHPDRFFLLRSGDLKEKIYAIYRKVSEAFEVLGDAQARRGNDEAEDDKVEPPTEEPASGPTGLVVSTKSEAAQRLVDIAQAAVTEGDLNHARLMLMLAQTYDRENAAIEEAPSARDSRDGPALSRTSGSVRVRSGLQPDANRPCSGACGAVLCVR